MQPEHPHQPDTAPHPDQTSPTFPSLRRHHPPTPTEPYRDTSPSSSTLRRRILLASGDVIRIDIRTPFENGGSGTKEGYPVHRSTTVRELKDGIAEGQYGEGSLWIRDGMRIVWQGRIVRDEEVIGDVVANSRGSDLVHTLHLVARRLGGTPAIPRVGSEYFNQSLPVPDLPEVVPAAPPIEEAVSQPSTSTRPETQALLDTIHYLIFTSRFHLFHLIGRDPLGWTETIPPPVIDQDTAREAVMSVVRAIVDAQSPEARESWVGWESAFGCDSQADMSRAWSEAGSRESVEKDIQSIWRERVGREWNDSEKGQVVEVEIDQSVFQLNLPRLSVMTAAQLIHLRTYLKICSILPPLYTFLPNPTPDTPQHALPTPTIPMPLPRPTLHSALVTAATSIPRVPIPVLSHMFFSGFKLVAMLWMMTQGMAWSDSRLWIIGGAATGWWAVDGYQRYVQERPRAPVVPPVNVPMGDGVPGVAQPGPNRAQIPRTPHTPQVPDRQAPHLAIPLIHLSTDTSQLRLVNDSMNPSRQLELAQTPSEPQSRPPRIITQLLLPMALWLITLIPEFEAIRARAIRRRERAMRVLVGELNAGVPEPTGEDGERTGPVEPILPQGLNDVARKYYLRTMERGEGIDWEEEREAQRALGIGREEEDGGGAFVGII